MDNEPDHKKPLSSDIPTTSGVHGASLLNQTPTATSAALPLAAKDHSTSQILSNGGQAQSTQQIPLTSYSQPNSNLGTLQLPETNTVSVPGLETQPQMNSTTSVPSLTSSYENNPPQPTLPHVNTSLLSSPSKPSPLNQPISPQMNPVESSAAKTIASPSHNFAHDSAPNPAPQSSLTQTSVSSKVGQQTTHIQSSEPNISSSSSKNGALDNILNDEDAQRKKKPIGVNSRFAKHLKKSDGEPFWRKDIQYDFLKNLFENPKAVFTNPFPDPGIIGIDNPPKYTFADLYVRTLAESGKSSKVLKERLLKDTEMGISVGKVCLLVNSGRMNTTINFVPEMRSTLRTYHSIPSLQADPVHGGSKPLQDTPRLKSILKSVCEGQEHLKSLNDLMKNPTPEKPNTNIIQLIFLLSNHSRGIKFLQEPNALNNNFMDFFLNEKIHPKSRAERFLWLVYTFLETSFTDEEVAKNPFGPHIPDEEYIPDDQIMMYDQDTAYEIKFSQEMIATRQRYLNDEEHNSTPKRGNKSKKDKDLDENEEDDISVSNTNNPSNLRKRLHSSIASQPASQAINSTEPTNNGNSHSTNSRNSNKSESSHISNSKQHKPNPEDDEDELGEGNKASRNSDHIINFPIKGLDKMVEQLPNSSNNLPSNKTSMASHLNLISKSKPVLRQLRANSKISNQEFNEKQALIKQNILKYFHYKKSSGNGLLGMEWENMRYDLINGIETFVYKQIGKQFHSILAPHASNTNSSTTTHSSSSLNTLNNGQNSNTIDEDIGFGFVPIYDFNKDNELNNYIHDLIEHCNEQLAQAELEYLKSSRHKDYVKIDLQNGKFDLNLEF